MITQGENNVVLPLSLGVDLTGATVEVVFKRGFYNFKKTATITDSLKGLAEVKFFSSDFRDWGKWKYQVSIIKGTDEVKQDQEVLQVYQGVGEIIAPPDQTDPPPETGSGILTYATLTELQSAYPSGTTQPVWITSENSWYYWEGSVVEPTPDTTAPVLTITPSATFTDTQTVTMSTNETANIWYTLDDSDPKTSGTKVQYTTPLTLTATDTIKAYAVDSASNESVVQSVTYTKEVVQTLNISDDFNRVDSSSLGTATTGQTWNGGLRVISNQAGSATGLTGVSAWNYMETNEADGIEISVDIIVPSGSTFTSVASGITFRYKDASNMYAFGAKGYNTIGIYQAGATGVTIPANKTLSMTGTHRLKVKLIGQTVECYVDGVLQFTFTDTVHTANTKHGIAAYNAIDPKYDNFNVVSI